MEDPGGVDRVEGSLPLLGVLGLLLLNIGSVGVIVRALDHLAQGEHLGARRLVFQPAQVLREGLKERVTVGVVGVPSTDEGQQRVAIPMKVQCRFRLHDADPVGVVRPLIDPRPEDLPARVVAHPVLPIACRNVIDSPLPEANSMRRCTGVTHV